MSTKSAGTLYTIGAYLLWGVFPLYFMWLRRVPALELISHRIVWSCLMLCGVLLLTRQWKAFCASVPRPRVIPTYLVAAVLIGINYPGTKAELRGCVNDVRRMYKCLVERYGFSEEDITVLIDTDDSYTKPTGKNIRKALADLVGSADSGD